MNSLAELIQELSPEEQEHVAEFVRQVLARRTSVDRQPWAFAWEGALKHLRARYTSVDLQHATLDERLGRRGPCWPTTIADTEVRVRIAEEWVAPLEADREDMSRGTLQTPQPVAPAASIRLG